MSFRETTSKDLAAATRKGQAPWNGRIRASDGKPMDEPFNPISGKPFNAINAELLSAAIPEGSDDSRFMTLVKAKSLDYKVDPDAKIIEAEFWQFEENFHKLDAKGEKVLDAEGKPVWEKKQLTSPKVLHLGVVHVSEIINPETGELGLGNIELETGKLLPGEYKPAAVKDPIAAGMAVLESTGIEVVNDQSDKAYFDKATGKVHMPPEDKFKSPESYLSTALHYAGEGALRNMNVGQDVGLAAEMLSRTISSQTKLPFRTEFFESPAEQYADRFSTEHSAVFRAATAAKKGLTFINEKDMSVREEMAQRQLANLKKTLNISDFDPNDRQYVTVPYEDKDKVKAIEGAQFDGDLKSWHVPKGTDPKLISKWENKDVVPGAAKKAVAEFKAFAESKGLVFAEGEEINFDGKFHNVAVTGQDTGKSGSYVLFPDGVTTGLVYNKQVSDEQHKFVYTGPAIDPNEKAALLAEANKRILDRSEDVAVQRREASVRAKDVLDNAVFAQPETCAMLKKEGFERGYGAHQNTKGDMILGIRDIEGNLKSIAFDNGKEESFLPASERQGGFHTIDPQRTLGNKGGTILVVETYKDAATVHEATGRPVVTVFEPGNMADVTAALREKYPETGIAIVPQNNEISLGNAKKAAVAAKAEVLSVEKGFDDINAVRKDAGKGKAAVHDSINDQLKALYEAKDQAQEASQPKSKGAEAGLGQ